MLFTIGAIVLFILAASLLILSIAAFFDENGDKTITSGLVIVAIVCSIGGWWLQTHRIISTQYVGVTKATISQELNGLYQSGIAPKPFLGTVYEYPSSTSYERCEQYTPAIKGSYGITLDLCFYYDASQTDWIKEINRTGSLNADSIMNVWRNSVVGDVARSVKDYTPEALSDNRSEVENSIFDNIAPWFVDRGVPLTRVSLKNWDFTSEEVAKSFDASIVSQRKITEQTALFEASKISREREMYEAETARLVAEQQKESLNLLGLEGDAAIQYLWIKVLSENNKTPDVLILGAPNVPVSIPLQSQEKPLIDSATP